MKNNQISQLCMSELEGKLFIVCIVCFTYLGPLLNSIGTNWERFQGLSWSPCHGVINVPIKSLGKNYPPKNFIVGLRTTSKYWKLCSLKIKIVLQISDEISVLLVAALGFKWNPLWHWISILDNHSSVHIRRATSHSHMTYAETVPSWFLLNLKVVQVTWNIL